MGSKNVVAGKLLLENRFEENVRQYAWSLEN